MSPMQTAKWQGGDIYIAKIGILNTKEAFKMPKECLNGLCFGVQNAISGVEVL